MPELILNLINPENFNIEIKKENENTLKIKRYNLNHLDKKPGKNYLE